MSKEFDESNLSEKQGKIIVAIISTIVIAAMVVLIVKIDHWNAESLERSMSKEEEETEALEQKNIDDLCGERLVSYTVDGKFDLEQFLYSYGFKATENGWIGEEGRLRFDFSTGEETPTIRYQYNDSGEEYQRTMTASKTVDDVNAKIGARFFTMSRDDVTALGRIVMGDPSDFQLTSSE